jgi:hypothetical protein
MMISIEGAPGVGKSTTAAALREGGGFVVPEVNQLFAKPRPEPATWYYERQVARWEMAVFGASRGQLALLDGDPFQPLWFPWIYASEGWPQDPSAAGFFRDRIAAGQMGVPDLYVFVHVAEAERRERMIARELKHGRTPEAALAKTLRYARMVEPQRRYFEALEENFPGWVLALETTSIGATVTAIRQAAPASPPVDPLRAFDFIARWLAATRP